ncbi:MAG: hypothetical protein sL5_03550 [Candidatus Mesenet longicola]|uniref:Tc1-like transposase DDE domain-containing protein n=1 Tax=Candidatus Mesenet longicola TaxID=1892558 RepID=A0A8J3HUA9_9RICK|nr:MAG: hypothetical protein sGL2_07620 [Candidatus Mesenet longicola]GHM59362.1 MAG: hypothetical protein sL5_03550 [Candidatus Mesenet longicola]
MKENVKNSKTKINKENLIFIDESGIDDNEFYAYGWAQKGKRLFAEKPAFKKKRISSFSNGTIFGFLRSQKFIYYQIWQIAATEGCCIKMRNRKQKKRNL